MRTKNFYYDGIWDAIVNHPQNDLSPRELDALKRFLPVAALHKKIDSVNILHLGIGNGREIPVFVNNFHIGVYVINDICRPALQRVARQARERFPSMSFREACADIEKEGVICQMRLELIGPTIIALVGNAGIFSNRNIDRDIINAMQDNDAFIVTVETPHKGMFKTYSIEPVYRWLSRSGLDVNANNASVWYDESDQCLKISCQGEILLASYKPKPEQLRQRLKEAGMAEVALCEYQDIHIVAGLFKKE